MKSKIISNLSNNIKFQGRERKDCNESKHLIENLKINLSTKSNMNNKFDQTITTAAVTKDDFLGSKATLNTASIKYKLNTFTTLNIKNTLNNSLKQSERVSTIINDKMITTDSQIIDINTINSNNFLNNNEVKIKEYLPIKLFGKSVGDKNFKTSANNSIREDTKKPSDSSLKFNIMNLLKGKINGKDKSPNKSKKLDLFKINDPSPKNSSSRSKSEEPKENKKNIQANLFKSSLLAFNEVLETHKKQNKIHGNFMLNKHIAHNQESTIEIKNQNSIIKLNNSNTKKKKFNFNTLTAKNLNTITSLPETQKTILTTTQKSLNTNICEIKDLYKENYTSLSNIPKSEIYSNLASISNTQQEGKLNINNLTTNNNNIITINTITSNNININNINNKNLDISKLKGDLLKNNFSYKMIENENFTILNLNGIHKKNKSCIVKESKSIKKAKTSTNKIASKSYDSMFFFVNKNIDNHSNNKKAKTPQPKVNKILSNNPNDQVVKKKVKNDSNIKIYLQKGAKNEKPKFANSTGFLTSPNKSSICNLKSKIKSNINGLKALTNTTKAKYSEKIYKSNDDLYFTFNKNAIQHLKPNSKQTSKSKFNQISKENQESVFELANPNNTNLEKETTKNKIIKSKIINSFYASNDSSCNIEVSPKFKNNNRNVFNLYKKKQEITSPKEKNQSYKNSKTISLEKNKKSKKELKINISNSKNSKSIILNNDKIKAKGSKETKDTKDTRVNTISTTTNKNCTPNKSLKKSNLNRLIKPKKNLFKDLISPTKIQENEEKKSTDLLLKKDKQFHEKLEKIDNSKLREKLNFILLNSNKYLTELINLKKNK